MAQPNDEKRQNILQKLTQYLNENVDSAYAKDLTFEEFDKNPVDVEYLDVRNNEELIRLLIGFISNPDKDFYHHVRSKLMKVKNIDLDKFFVEKRSNTKKEINRNAPLSVIEAMDLSAGYYDDYSNEDFSLHSQRAEGKCELYIQSHKATSEFRNLQQEPEQFIEKVKVSLDQRKEIDVPLYVDVYEVLSTLATKPSQYEETELSVHYNMYDVLNAFFYLGVTDGNVSLPMYMSVDKNYTKILENKPKGRYLSLDSLYGALLDLLAESEFISYKKLHNHILSLSRESFKSLTKLSEIKDRLDEIVEEEEVYQEEIEQRQYHEMCRKKHKSSKARQGFDSYDNMWNIDLSSKSAQDKFARQHDGRMWSDSWSESFLNALDDESGSGEIDVEFLSKESLLALLDDKTDVKMKIIPVIEFYKRLDLLCRDLNDDNIDHFIRNAEKLVGYLCDIDNRDLVVALKRKNEEERKEITVQLLQSINDTMKNIKEALDNKHIRSGVLSDTLQSLADVKMKIIRRI